jgi:hypothetical protein
MPKKQRTSMMKQIPLTTSLMRFFRSRLLSNPIEAKAGARNPMAAPRLLLETAVHLGHMLRQLLVLELVELGRLAQRKHWSYGKGHTYMVNHGLIMSEKQ